MSSANEILTAEQLTQLEEDLLQLLSSQGMNVEEIKLTGLKGSGDFSTVFALRIDGVHHTLKVYRHAESFQREIRHLRRQIPNDRFLFVWPASSNRFNYFIVIIEVPDGTNLHERMLSPVVSDRFGDCLIRLHSLTFKKKKISVTEINRLLDEAYSDAVSHAGLFPELGEQRVTDIIDAAKSYLQRHSQVFRVQRSRAHNDLWWANVIVAEEDVYLIDWENLGRDDYCKDLSFFRLMVNYERTAAPVSMWYGEPENTAIDAFFNPILQRYPEHFNDETFWQRYGLYAVQQGVLIFARAYYGDRRGSKQALNIVKTGIRLFEDHCLSHE